MPRRRQPFRAFALALALAAAATPAAGAASSAAGLFGLRATRYDGISVFPKWRDALARARAEARDPAEACGPTAFDRCPVGAWHRFLAGLRAASRRTQIEAVNRFMNRHPYILDPVNWGVPDYWAAPGQFLARDGDCEDYAIAKFLSLRALGFDDAALRIVVLQDLNLGVAHAVLAVYLGGETLILDNQVADVVPARAIHHYRPIYSVNESHWWLYRS